MGTTSHDVTRSEKMEPSDITWHVSHINDDIMHNMNAIRICTNLVRNGKTPHKCGHGTHFSEGEMIRSVIAI